MSKRETAQFIINATYSLSRLPLVESFAVLVTLAENQLERVDEATRVAAAQDLTALIMEQVEQEEEA
jgi:hypothetical protein